MPTFFRLSFLLIFFLSTGSCYGTSSTLFAPAKNPIVWNSGIADLFSRLLNTSGTVYSLAQARKTSSKSDSNSVQVSVEKTGGKAKTEITICVQSDSGLTTVKRRYTFANGNYTRTRSFTITGAADKKIVVYLKNKSATLKFKYKLTVDES